MLCDRMAKDACETNLSGQWSGEFSYPQNLGPVTPFVARIEDAGFRLSGVLLEPDIVRGGTIEAALTGIRHGSAVDFVKSYAGAAIEDYATPVDYVGSVSGDGNVISGVWSLLDMDGRFEMRREATDIEEATAILENEVDVVEPATNR